MKIDIFGDGECIFDRKNLPDEIIASSGKWKKTSQESGKPSYSLAEPSQWYIDSVVEPSRKQAVKKQKEIERQGRVARKLQEIAERELEKEEAGS